MIRGAGIFRESKPEQDLEILRKSVIQKLSLREKLDFLETSVCSGIQCGVRGQHRVRMLRVAPPMREFSHGGPLKHLENGVKLRGVCVCVLPFLMFNISWSF